MSQRGLVHPFWNKRTQIGVKKIEKEKKVFV